MSQTDAEVKREVKALIRWYECRGKCWLSAAEFTLARHSGTMEALLHPRWRVGVSRYGKPLGRPRNRTRTPQDERKEL